MTATDATRAAHPEYTAGAMAFLLDGKPQARRGIIVQCPTVDHDHTEELGIKAVMTEDPEVGLAWVVTANAKDGITAMEAAYTAAEGLAMVLLLSPFQAG